MEEKIEEYIKISLSLSVVKVFSTSVLIADTEMSR